MSILTTSAFSAPTSYVDLPTEIPSHILHSRSRRSVRLLTRWTRRPAPASRSRAASAASDRPLRPARRGRPGPGRARRRCWLVFRGPPAASWTAAGLGSVAWGQSRAHCAEGLWSACGRSHFFCGRWVVAAKKYAGHLSVRTDIPDSTRNYFESLTDLMGVRPLI